MVWWVLLCEMHPLTDLGHPFNSCDITYNVLSGWEGSFITLMMMMMIVLYFVASRNQSRDNSKGSTRLYSQRQTGDN